MSNQTPAYVRTGTPIAAGAAIVYFAQVLGLELSADQATLVVPVVMYAYYVLGRFLESYNPKLGYVLGIAKAPAYSNEPAPSPGPGEEVVAEVVPEEVDPQPVDEPVEVEADTNVGLLASHAGASPIDPPKPKRRQAAPRKQP